MELLRNLPTDSPALLSKMIAVQPGRVVSMSLSRSTHCSLTLLAFADSESVSEEAYDGDTLYWVLEGTMPLREGGREHMLHAGECIAVPARTLHAVGGAGSFKLLQMTLNQ